MNKLKVLDSKSPFCSSRDDNTETRYMTGDSQKLKMKGKRKNREIKEEWVRILISGYQTSDRLSSSGNQSSERLSTEANVEKDYCVSHSNYG